MQNQAYFEFMNELIVDNFAGGGGASLAIGEAIGRPVDIAINHDPEAITMHTANHPDTEHYCENVWQVDPREVVGGRRVGLAWFSPDCTHHSKAKGGKPRKKKIRGLAWIVLKWAGLVRPRIIMLENVEEFEDWGPLTRSGKPCKKRKGMTFQQWKSQLESLGYVVDYKELRACDYGAPTIRKRLFLVARCDGRQIVWPTPTHGAGLQPYKTAADIIDWSIPCPSIFERKKPLAENTLRRIAKGIQRYVLDAADPFIVPIAHYNGSTTVHNINEPVRTVTASPKGGSFALAVPYVVKHFGGATGAGIERPFPTVLARGTQNQLCAAFLQRHFGNSVGHGADEPAGTVMGGGGGKTSLVTSHLIKLRGTCKDGQDIRRPLPTVTAGGLHLGEVRAFLIKYYGTAIGADLHHPLHTVTSKHRMGLITVQGEDYQIVDIGMRMLSPRELYRAQDFPDSYIIDPMHGGKKLTKTAQVRMCGNSVSRAPALALIRANICLSDSGRIAV